MRSMIIALCFVIWAPYALAADEIVATVTRDLNDRWWPTRPAGGYYMSDSEGNFDVSKGGITSGTIKCHGAGFWEGNKIGGSGVCQITSNSQYWTAIWKFDSTSELGRGPEGLKRTGTWEIVNGTGKFTRIMGSGTFRSIPEIDGKSTSVWEGQITLPE